MVRYITENDEDTLYEPLPGARLVLIVDGREGQSFPLRGTVHLGRDKTNSVVVADQKVSRHHAMLMPVGNTYILTDQGSANGTYLNGVLISQPTRLKPRDKIGLGDTLFMFAPDATDLPVAEAEVYPHPHPRPAPVPEPAARSAAAIQPAGSKLILPGLENHSVWAVIGCMALFILGLLLVLAAVMGLLLGRGQVVSVLLFWAMQLM